MGLLTEGNPKPFAREYFPSAHATFLQAVALTKAPATALRSSSVRMRQQSFATSLLQT